MNILKRFEQAIASGQRAIRASGKDGAPRPRVALMAMRDTLDTWAGALPGDVSVLITDARDVAAYQHPGVATEYLMPVAEFPDRFAPQDSEAYIVRRLAILRVKWRIGAVYIAGEGARVLADLWLADPEGPPRSFFKPAQPRGRG